MLTNFENGTPVMVHYDPDNLHEFTFESAEASLLPLVFGIGFIIAAFVLIRPPSE